MISYISGKIIELSSNIVEILTDGGIGYELNINEITYAELSKKTLEEKVELYVYHHITEGNQALFAFLEKEDKLIFKELIKISGVGGKVAMLILSLGKYTLSEAVLSEDKKVIESVKGIGKKMAEKIILELKDKDFIKLNYSDSANNLVNSKVEQKSHIDSELKNNILETLVNMGYSQKLVAKELDNIPKDMKEAGEIIPFIIKNL